MSSTKSASDKLIDSVWQHIHAGFPAVWIESLEYDRVIPDLIASVPQTSAWLHYDVAKGLAMHPTMSRCQSLSSLDPAAAANLAKMPTLFLASLERIIREYAMLNSTPGIPEETPTILLVIIRNAHFRQLLGDTEVMTQWLEHLLPLAKSSSVCFVFTGNSQKLPKEISRSVVILEHALPDKARLEQVGKDLMKQDLGLNIPEPNWDMVSEAAKGLTETQAENAFSLSLVKNLALYPEEIWDIKSQEIKKTGLLEIYAGTDSFKSLGGLEGFKSFATGILSKRFTDHRLRPKGLLLLGVPGAGKSASVKCLGFETGRKILSMNMGNLRSKYQGESENNFRHALKLADSMEPCILFIDEIEKGLGGSTNSDGDSGVGSRIFGSFLTWLNDHTTDVLVIGTCNDMKALPSAFVRAERFDGVFFYDLPTQSERSAIWRIFLQEFDLFDFAKKSSEAFAARILELTNLSVDWTGAEIRTCCRLARMMDKRPEHVADLVPIFAKRHREELRNLRSMARQMGCLSASKPGSLYTTNASAASDEAANDGSPDGSKPPQKRKVSLNVTVKKDVRKG